MPQPHALSIATSLGTQAPTAEHKRFQTLLAKTEKAKARLQQWQEQLPLFAQGWNSRVQPEQDRLSNARCEWALEMESLLLGRKWTLAESRTLSRALLELCEELLAQAPEQETIKALYNRHAEVDFDTQNQEGLEDLAATISQMSGLDLGEQKYASADELLDHLQQEMAKARAEQTDARTEPSPWEAAKAQRPRKLTKAQEAARLKAEAASAQTSKTVREVYRKLAGELHPDRTPASASDAERASRTAQMQAANRAYETGDLLALLALQLEVQQVDASQAARMAATQVQAFIKVLKEQLAELEAEIEDRQSAFESSYGVMIRGKLDPHKLGEVLTDAVRHVEYQKLELAQHRRLLGGAPAGARALLKEWKRQQQMDDRFDGFMF